MILATLLLKVDKGIWTKIDVTEALHHKIRLCIKNQIFPETFAYLFLSVVGYFPDSWTAGRFCDSAQICQVPERSECAVFLQGNTFFFLSFPFYFIILC
jgi:hypothetical protein